MRLYDSRTSSLVDLVAEPQEVGMYFCGPTVYGRAHVGNARPFIVAMWLRAWLIESGRSVRLVHNITDVNDKIYQAAPGRSGELAAAATQWYLEDIEGLGLGMPDEIPRVTACVPEIVAFIVELVERGAAYVAGVDVYFRVRADADYGVLSGRRLEESEDTDDINDLKERAEDFALWKGSKEGEDTRWDSPWGPGRPGWHIECSVMAEQYLGSAFEIHGGGLDLLFPHHENELAQSRALGHDFARIWMHNGMLRFSGEKMSKSEGNIATLREVLDEWGAETLLLFMMNVGWASAIDFNGDTMRQARARAATFRNAFLRPAQAPDPSRWAELATTLEDNLDTPAALKVLHGWADDAQLELLERGLTVFGLGGLAVRAEAPAEVVALAERRQELRRSREWAEADDVRDEIERAGWSIREDADGYVLALLDAATDPA